MVHAGTISVDLAGRLRLLASLSSPAPLIWLVALGLLVVPPVILVVLTSVLSGTPSSLDTTLSLNAWVNLLSPQSWPAIGNTLLIAGVTTLVAVPIGAFFAWLDVQTDVPNIKLLCQIQLLPLVFSPLLTTIAWTILAAPHAGVFNSALRSAFGVAPFNIYTIKGMIWISVLYFVPVAYLATRGAFRSIDGSVLESARVAAIPMVSSLMRVVAPLLTPALAAAALLVFTLGIGQFAVVTLLGPTARVESLQFMAYQAMIESPTAPPTAAAVGTLLLIFTFVMLALYQWVLRRPARFVTVSGKGFRPVSILLGPMKWVALAFVVIYLLAGVVLPYLALAYGAFTPFLTPEIAFDRLSFRNFELFMSDDSAMRATQNTLILSIIGAAMTTLLATALAYVVRSRTPIARMLEAVALLPRAIPALAFALGLLWYVLSLGPAGTWFYGSLYMIYLAQFACFMPVALNIINGGMIQLGAEMEEAARVGGIPVISRFCRIIVPPLRPTIASAWLMMALYVSVEAGMSIFLYTGRSITTAVLIFSNAMGGKQSVVFAGAALLATFGVIAVALGNRLFGAGRHLSG